MEDHESYAQDSNHLLKYQLLVQWKGSEVSVISMFLWKTFTIAFFMDMEYDCMAADPKFLP